MSHDEIIEVVQAHKDGKMLQIRSRKNADEWKDYRGIGDFDTYVYEYRVKPEPPKPREWWFVKNLGHGAPSERWGWTRCDVYQDGVAYLEQVHVREVIE